MYGCNATQQLQINNSAVQNDINKIVRIDASGKTIIKINPDTIRNNNIRSDSIMFVSTNGDSVSISINDKSEVYYYGYSVQRTIGTIVFSSICVFVGSVFLYGYYLNKHKGVD